MKLDRYLQLKDGDTITCPKVGTGTIVYVEPEMIMIRLAGSTKVRWLKKIEVLKFWEAE